MKTKGFKVLAAVLLIAALALAVPAFADVVVEPEPVSTGANAPLIAALVIVAVVAVILLAVFIKRRRASK